ncbi:MAG: anhydro-N-acetylmuramic acid kinase [Sphingobacteriaceae bacterium]|nr:anhydro-N-acetylmuramic acid kinase [Sphingobacteriaceae bacterium]
MTTESWRVLGLMSGSSLDGLDLCLAHFEYHQQQWHFRIEKATTQSYPAELQSALRVAHLASLPHLLELEVVLGGFFVEAIQDFLNDVDRPHLISTHGHTILHQPSMGYTLQIGGAPQLAAAFKIPVAYDFRSADVALGGQGAPLVPVGDALLFGEYAACLNLGGIANISYDQNQRRLAFDLAYCNMSLNYLSNQLGRAYDDGGSVAAAGALIPALSEKLNAWDFYRMQGPKSLGREQFEAVIRPMFDDTAGSLEDKLHTFTLHLAQQLSDAFKEIPREGKVLITGGGAFNSYLVDQLQLRTRLHLEVPSPLLIAQKEALIFGFLGLLRYLRLPNVLSSVTGSTSNHCAGSLIELFP